MDANNDNMDVDGPSTTTLNVAQMAQLALQNLEPDGSDDHWTSQFFASNNDSTNIFGSDQQTTEASHALPSNGTSGRGGLSLLEQAVMQHKSLFGAGESSGAGTTIRDDSIDLDEIVKAVNEAHPGEGLTISGVSIPSLTTDQKKEYVRDPDSWTVKYVYDEDTNDEGQMVYKAKFMDGHRDEVDLRTLEEYNEGTRAFNAFIQEGPPSRDSSEDESSRKRRKLSRHGTITIDSDQEDELAIVSYRRNGQRSMRSRGNTRHVQLTGSEYDSEESNNDKRRSGRTKKRKNYADPKYDEFDDYDEDDKEQSTSTAPKATRVPRKVENFRKWEGDEDFAKFHMQSCGTCDVHGPEKGRLVYCQGCSMAYHQVCIGRVNQTKHLVTRVTEDEWVLQCRKCINEHLTKDPNGAKYDRCTTCGEEGPACKPFRDLSAKKATPTTDSASNSPAPEDVKPGLVNNVKNILFRCVECSRGFHFHHLPYSSLDEEDDDTDVDGNKLTEEKLALDRMEMYSQREEQAWSCADCCNVLSKVESIVAWRPIGEDIDKTAEYDFYDYQEDEKEYLVKYEHYSYLAVKWVPGGWAYGYLTRTMLQAFARKHPPPQYSIEEAVPQSFITVEIIMEVAFSEANPYPQDVHKDVQLERIDTISRAFVKFQGLDYDQVAWEEPPTRDSGPLWEAFERAYANYVEGFFTHVPTHLKAKNEEARSKDFGEYLELKNQPEYLSGGEMMDYQKEGMNWLYYKWYSNEPCILADEMGLGKTLQAISLMAILKEKHGIWPFLVVAPHSTIPNWKREIEKWAPGLRVASYYGGKEARKIQREYELFHKGSTTQLKCHVVVTSYTTPVDDIQLLKKIPWQVLIVDEGQRLKNDKGQIFQALKQYKFGHKVLLTGTPLQNNQRELFNLLHFLEPKEIDPEMLEERYAELNEENIKELHAMIRPYFLRRTKAATLGFLPPMAEIIVPVSMSSLQKKLYKTILAKDANLIRSIFSRKDSKVKEKAKLSNILMQLRKCLGHPFLYRPEIEEEAPDKETAHRSLIDAASKLQLLEVMLPKLHARGHRVLFFTQFLGMLDILEDFLLGMGLECLRLDGSTSSLDRQKRIDAFNAEGSKYFAFLLSTRAGGVGINLASADTVIVMDPDFNPHQDLQALSRAHRIGQKNKVLVFFLMNRGTVEERIMELGKKKLSLDHVIIEQMDEKEDVSVDVENILKFGARALFEDEDEESNGNFKYDSESIDNLLDRSTLEKEHAIEKTAENAFSFARIWETKSKGFTDQFSKEAEDDQASVDMWDKIIKEREEEMRREAVRRQALQGNSRLRARQKMQYVQLDDDFDEASSDAEYQAPQHPDSDDEDHEPEMESLHIDGFVDDLAVKGSSTRGLAGERSRSMTNIQTPIPVVSPEDAEKFRQIQGKQLIETAQRQQRQQQPYATGFSQAPPLPQPQSVQGPQLPQNGQRLQSLYQTGSTGQGHPHMGTAPDGQPSALHRNTPYGHMPHTGAQPVQFPQPNAYVVPTVFYNNQGQVVRIVTQNACNACGQVHGAGMCIFDLAYLPTGHPQQQQRRDIHPAMNRASPLPNGTHSQPQGVRSLNMFTPIEHRPNSTTPAPKSRPQQAHLTVKPNAPSQRVKCIICCTIHLRGQCPMRLREPERCPLCAGMHFAASTACPHMKSVTYVTRMIDSVRKSTGDEKQKANTLYYLRGRKGTLIRTKKAKANVPVKGCGSSTPTDNGFVVMEEGNRRKTIAAHPAAPHSPKTPTTSVVLSRGLGGVQAKGRKSLGSAPIPNSPTLSFQVQHGNTQLENDWLYEQNQRLAAEKSQQREQHQRLLQQAQMQAQQRQQSQAQQQVQQQVGRSAENSIMIDDSD